MKGLPSGYNKDLQEDKEAVFDAEATLSASLRATHVAVVTSRAECRSHRTRGLGIAAGHRRRRLSRGRGMPFRKAHEVVGALVRRLLAEGRTSVRSPSRNGGTRVPCSAATQRAISALASVEARRTPQSTNPAAVRASLEECRQWLENATSQPYAAAQGQRPGRQECRSKVLPLFDLRLVSRLKGNGSEGIFDAATPA